MSSDDKIDELLDLLSEDNLKVTINSSDAVEKLSLHLSWMLTEIEEDRSLLPSLLSRGILNLIKFFQQVFCHLSATCECNPKILASLEDVLEILYSIGNIGSKRKCTVVLQFGESLLTYINYQVLPFNFRLKIVKYTNLLFESCPIYVKDCLYSKSSFKKSLKHALKLISLIGDYEFQVGIIECAFRVISKQKRVEALKALCSQEILYSILAVKDESFEADCRRVLNTFNSQQGAQQRVFSIPCLDVTLGNLQLQKPKDDNYKEFWIDFNASSKRISFYCSQIVDSEDPQDTDEDIWETICILKDYIQEISATEGADEIFAVQFKFVPSSIELVPGFTLEKYPFMRILFKDKDAVLKAIQEVFSNQKCSIAKNQICIKETKKPFQANELLPSTYNESEDVNYCQAHSTASSQLSAPTSVRKSSIPSEIWCSKNSSNSICEVGAIRISQQSLNQANNIKRTGSRQMSKSNVNNETAVKDQPQSQHKATKTNNSADLKNFRNSVVPCISNVEEIKSQILKSGKCQAFQKNKKTHPKSSINIKDQTNAFDFSSAEEDEAIPPTFETKPPSKDDIQSKNPANPLINSSKASSYKQNKTLSTTKNSDNTYSDISSNVRSNQTNGQKLSEIVEEKRENKSLQNQNISPQEKERKHCEKTQLEKVATDARSNDLNKPIEDLVISSNHDIGSNDACSTNKKESCYAPKAQKSFLSHSVSFKNTNSDQNISSKINSETNTTTSRKGRRLRSFESLDLLPQNYPLPKDKHSTENSKKISPSKKKNSNITTKHLDEDKVIIITETQPESAKVEEVQLIPDSPLPLQTDTGKPEEDQPKHKPTGPAKFSAKNKPLVDSGISSSNNSPAFMNDLPSTTLKKRNSSSPQRNQRNLSTKQTKSLFSSENKTIPKTDVKTNNEIEKRLNTSGSKQHNDNKQNQSNKSVSKEKEESSFQFPSNSISPLEIESQDSCYVPITRDNLSKFNKGVQKTLAKELDERIEKFVKASCQNISETSNAASLFSDDTMDKQSKNQSTSFKNNQDFMHDKTNGEKNDFVENNPLPSKISPEVHTKSSVINRAKKTLKDQSCSSFSMKAKTPSEQKENNRGEIYQAIKLGSVSDFSNDPKQIDKRQKKPSNLAFSPLKTDKVPAVSQKPQLLINRSRSLDSAKLSMGREENKNPGKIVSSPTEKLFKKSPLKRRCLSLKRDKIATKVNEKKKGYDPYDFDSGSSVAESVPPAATCPRPSKASISPMTKKKENSILCQYSVGSTQKTQISKGKKMLQFKHSEADLEDSYKFEKESKKNDTQYVMASPECISDSDFDSPQPKKRGKEKITKSKITANSSLPPLDLTKRNTSRISIRKRKNVNYKEVSSVDSSISFSRITRHFQDYSSLSGPVHEHKQKKMNTPIKQKLTFLHNDSAYNFSDQEDQMKDASGYNTSHTQQSEVSWIKKPNSPKIHVEKTYAIKKQSTYYGLYACIPKRKHNESPKNNRRNKPKKLKEPVTKELSPKVKGHNTSLQLNGKTDHNSSPQSVGAHNPERPKKMYSPRHDKENHNFSFSSDYQIKKKTKRKKAWIKESFLCDSIEIQRADSFDMFTDDLRPNISILETECDIQDSSSHRVSSFSNKFNISDPEITLDSTEDPKLLIPTPGGDSSLLSINDEPIITDASKLMLTASPYFTIDDLKSNSDKQEQSIISSLDKDSLGKKPETLTSSKSSRLEEDISHSTPVKDYDLGLSPLSCAGDDYKSETSLRKSLFSNHKLNNSNGSKKSSILSPIAKNRFLFHGNSLEKDEYGSKGNFCPTLLSDSDKSADMDSSDDSSSESRSEKSSEKSTRNDMGSYNLHSDKSSHLQTGSPVTYKDNSIKNIIGTFSEDMKKSFQTRQHKTSTVVEDILKSTQKALHKICENDDQKRSEIHFEFNKKIERVMNKLEDSTKTYEEQKTNVLNYVQEQMKDLQKIKDIQKKSLDKLKTINSLYHQSLNTDVNSSHAQHQVQNVMKSQMQKLQSKLLNQARQQEMQQMRKQLHKMLL